LPACSGACVPAFFVPLLGLAAWTLISSAFSSDPAVSFLRDRQLLYYLIVPLTMQVARGPRAATAVNIIIAIGAASALIGVTEYFILGFDGPIRPAGLLGKNYMTYSGVIMLVTCAALARLVNRGSEWIWPAVAVPALLVALFASQSRNAYVGALAGLVCLLSLKNWKLLVAVPVLIGLFAVGAPVKFRDRAFSIFDSTNATNRDRVSMLKSGVAMIEDHPLFGVGPNMVTKAYGEKYKRPDAFDPVENPGASRSHLHNVAVQLAAERGLPALLAWLGFIVLAGRDLLKQALRGPANPLAAMGLSVLVAAVVAGLFEHNFGDSEFLVLFLGLITLPFAAAAGPDGLSAKETRA
jgi:O-antigen ligase